MPTGDPVRLTSLIRAVAHGAADLASPDTSPPTAKGIGSPHQLTDDLFDHLRSPKQSPRR